jgi:hypothetical protein
MGRYKPTDLARLGPDAQKQIRLTLLAATMQELEQQRRSKYGNVVTEVDGRKFDSKAEAARYGELKLLQRSGRITELVCQPEFPITVHGVTVAKYIADFEYRDQDGKRIIEDVKSSATAKNPCYRLKRKLVEVIHRITVTEVMA